MTLVVPAVLPTSREDLEKKLASFAQIKAVSRVQIDVVDGRFASPPSWPYSVKASQDTPYFAKATQSELEVMVKNGEMLPYLDRITYEIDLMCTDAEHATEAWLALGATRLTFHAESTTDLGRLLSFASKRYGDLAHLGIALNLASDLALTEPYLGTVSYVQFMGIARIGRQGQPLDERVFEKIRVFRERHPDIPVQVDGGVSLLNAKKLIALGVSNLVVGSALSRARDTAAVLARFEELQSPYGV